MKILVTGATGFVGGHLLPELSLQGWQIVAAVRQKSPDLSLPIQTVQVGEIDGNTDWRQGLNHIDSVVHLAARAHQIRDTAEDPAQEFLRVNTEGTANLVRACVEAGVKHFVFVSSIGAVATTAEEILTENSTPRPDTPYGRSKLQAEEALIDIAKNTDMTWTILRPPLVYGAGNPGNMARLIKLVDLGLPLPFGAVNNRRSLIYVGNLVSAIATCLTHPAAAGRLFVVSDTETLSTAQLIRAIALQLQRRCWLVPIPPGMLVRMARVGDGLNEQMGMSLPLNSATIDRLLGSLAIDNAEICTSLNWQPPYSLSDGLGKTLAN